MSKPQTEQAQWLLDHQGLINIGRVDGSMRGDEIDLRQSLATIEAQARALALAEIRREVESTHAVKLTKGLTLAIVDRLKESQP